MQSVSPVWDKVMVDAEKPVGKDGLIVVPFSIRNTETGEIHERFAYAMRLRLTKAEIRALRSGADLVITELVGKNPFAPVSVQICFPKQTPKFPNLVPPQ